TSTGDGGPTVVGPPSLFLCFSLPAVRSAHRRPGPSSATPDRCDTGPIHRFEDATAVDGVCRDGVNTLWTVGISGGAPPADPTADPLHPEWRASRWPGAC